MSNKRQPRQPVNRSASSESGGAKSASRPPRQTSKAAQSALMAMSNRQTARKRLIYRVILPMVVIVAVVLGLVIAKSNSSTKNANKTTAAAAGVVTALTTIPAATYDKIGAGTIATVPTAISAPALTADGKPRVLYVGAEYCPYCAAERWSVVAALSRFGTFSGLGETQSSSSDAYPSTNTLSFHGSTFASDTLSFTGYETTTNQPDSSSSSGYGKLDTVSDSDMTIVDKYNAAPYLPSSSAGAIPFVDLGGKYLISGASYSPQLLQGKTYDQIVDAIGDPTTSLSQAVLGTANVITAAICASTDNKPADVCTSAGVLAGKTKLSAKS